MGGTWSNPNFFINAGDGPLDMDRTHQVKLSGAYLAPYGVTVGTTYVGQSGYAYTRTFRQSLNRGNADINAEPQGSSRLPFQHLLDVRVEKRFPVRGLQPRVYLEAFNLLNRNTATLIGAGVNTTNYGQITQILPPRIFRLGLGLSF